MTSITLMVNGEEKTVEAPPMKRLLDVLREDLHLTGAKEGCGEGECGSCSVLMNGELVNSCLVPVLQAEGATITTIEGGTLQAVGWALLEEIKLQDGRYLNDRLATYIIPTIRDSPRIDVHLLERDWEGGPFGAKGVGELPMDGGAPAILQAIENATGIVPTEVPATPERLFALGALTPNRGSHL